METETKATHTCCPQDCPCDTHFCSEFCRCDACVKRRADFDAYVADTANRWAKAWAEGRVAHRHSVPCANPSCPQSLTAPSGLVMEAVR